GKRLHVEPRQIVGALANEGGLSRGDFGKIEIKPAFWIVELPVDLDPAVLDKLSGTRISGVLINIKPDKFDRGHKRGHAGPAASPSKSWSSTKSESKKPRHKKREY
ncbi:MAG: DbpA RNA binding domain-containing protein, partial [Marmoricola sp.]